MIKVSSIASRVAVSCHFSSQEIKHVSKSNAGKLHFNYSFICKTSSLSAVDEFVVANRTDPLLLNGYCHLSIYFTDKHWFGMKIA